MEDIEIAEIRKLVDFTKEKFDYDFKNYALSSFKRRVRRVLDLYKFASVNALIHKLTVEPSFIEEFVSEITVNVTEMFRDPSFWSALRDDILPNLLSSHNKLNIWHAGCSSGEEVFSMAVVLKEINALNKVSLMATDIDSAILQQAKKGEVPLKNMDLNGKNFERYGGKGTLSNYYSTSGNMAVLKPELLSGTNFRKHNLVNNAVFSRFDLVLCRNVMIYFNQTLQNEVLHKLHESLFKYGYLAIGTKESLIWCDIANKFIVVNNEEKVYKKIKD